MWPRNKYTGSGGGLYTGPGEPYMSNIPLWEIFIKKLEEYGYKYEAEMIKKYILTIKKSKIFRLLNFNRG